MKIFCASISRKKIKYFLKTKQIIFSWQLKTDSEMLNYSLVVNTETNTVLIRYEDLEILERLLENIDSSV